ncbi:MAG TPA: hypothetical protein VHH73_01245 [Verrucomicrobiae bacterium]|nr:hypothetical protein [Verrucomicrobiae bacterium]
MKNTLLSRGILLAIAILTACQSARPSKPLPATANATALSTRNNCYSLLHQLLDEQKDVSLLRFIKREPDDLKTLVKAIAADSGKGAKMLEEFARQDPAIRLDDYRLPPGETATREAEAATTRKEILQRTGQDFELALLLSQFQALGYARHLAKVGAENDPQPERSRALATLGEEMARHYHQLFALLRSKTK